MTAEDREAKAFGPEGNEAWDHSFGELARQPVDGIVSRRQALKRGGSALLGGLLAFVLRVALVDRKETGHAVRGRRPAGERGQIAAYGGALLVGTPSAWPWMRTSVSGGRTSPRRVSAASSRSLPTRNRPFA